MMLTESLGSLTDNRDFRLILSDQFPKEKNAIILDKKTGVGFKVLIVSRRLGEDTGKDILLNLGRHLDSIRSYMRQKTRRPDEQEQRKLLQLLRMPFGA
jgi:hypothetical protein